MGKSTRDYNYAIVYQDEDITMCYGVYPYFEAIGRITCKIADNISELLENDYEITKKDEFVELEADTGFGWFLEANDKDRKDRIRKETWYLLIADEY